MSDLVSQDGGVVEDPRLAQYGDQGHHGEQQQKRLYVDPGYDLGESRPLVQGREDGQGDRARQHGGEGAMDELEGQ